jgi:hypothetical protein
MREKAVCQGAVVVGQIVKVLLTWQRAADKPQESILLNVLDGDENFARDKVFYVTIEEAT